MDTTDLKEAIASHIFDYDESYKYIRPTELDAHKIADNIINHLESATPKIHGLEEANFQIENSCKRIAETLNSILTYINSLSTVIPSVKAWIAIRFGGILGHVATIRDFNNLNKPEGD